jgi:hypothetical protein
MAPRGQFSMARDNKHPKRVENGKPAIGSLLRFCRVAPIPRRIEFSEGTMEFNLKNARLRGRRWPLQGIARRDWAALLGWMAPASVSF